MLDGVQQGGVDASEPSDHAGVGLVALAGARVNSAKFAWIGNDDFVPQGLPEPADPRTVGSHLHCDAGFGILLRESPERIAVIGDGPLFDDLARLVEDADRVGLVSEVGSDGDAWDLVFHDSS